MKKLLLILLIVPCFCCGQKPLHYAVDSAFDRMYFLNDSLLVFQYILYKDDTCTLYADTILYNKWKERKELPSMITLENGLAASVSPSDTIKVLMLVCDTSFSWITRRAINGQFFNTGDVWGQFGYVVEREQHTKTSDTGGIWRHEIIIDYLDENKKPLLKSTIVWLTKEIK